MRRTVSILFSLALFYGCEPASPPAPRKPPDAAGPVAIDTQAPSSIHAGELLSITCRLVDSSGVAVSPATAPTVQIIPEAALELQPNGQYRAIRAGTVEASCEASSPVLRDPTPSVIAVAPGAPIRVVTQVTPATLAAGDEATVSCAVFDGYDNVVEAAPTIAVEPAVDGNVVAGQTLFFIRAGTYGVNCALKGTDAASATLLVTPALPASLTLAVAPVQPVYAVDDEIAVTAAVRDRFDNPVTTADVALAVTPTAQLVDPIRFRFLEDGVHTLTATITSPTEKDVPLEASLELFVDSASPTIACDEPVNGANLELAPGAKLTFRGKVSDASDLASVKVNGVDATFDVSGEFMTELTVDHGIELVHVVAIDGSGRASSRTCAFLVSSAWEAEDSSFKDLLSLYLGPALFDDGDRTNDTRSFADFAQLFVTSSAPLTALDKAMVAENPLQPSTCHLEVQGTCTLNTQVRYLAAALDGPHSTQLLWKAPGLVATVRFENVRLKLRVNGRVSGYYYDSTGWITFADVEVTVPLTPSLGGGQLGLVVGAVEVDSGVLSTDFPSIDSSVEAAAVPFFDQEVRELVELELRDWTQMMLHSLLGDLLGSVAFEGIGSYYATPPHDGSALAMTVSRGLSSSAPHADGLLLGFSSRSSTPRAHERPSRGIPVLAKPWRRDVVEAAPAGSSMPGFAVGQALHALWRGGFFDGAIGAGTIPALPTNVSATIAMELPPVATFRDDGSLELAFGALSIALEAPTLAAQPPLTVGAKVVFVPDQAGGTFGYRTPSLQTLVLGSARPPAELEPLVEAIVEELATSAVKAALPVLPLPRIELPPTLTSLGVPPGASLRIEAPSAKGSSGTLVLQGIPEVK